MITGSATSDSSGHSTAWARRLVTPADERARRGWMERFGREYFERVAQAEAARLPHDTDLLSLSPAQEAALRRRESQDTVVATAIAFIAGAISAGGSVWVGIATEDQGFWLNYTYIGLVTAVLSVAEFAVLFYVSLWLVARLAVLSGTDGRRPDPVYPDDRVSGLLARAALEIPDPVMHVMGIDPLKHVSKRQLWLLGLLYKVKVIISNVVARVLLTRLMGRYVLRVSVSYIAVPITGLWNAWVTVKVARDARLRLHGQAVVGWVRQQLEQLDDSASLSPAARLAALQAAGNVVVLTQNYHPNMLLLLVALVEALGEPPARERPRLDDWGHFLQTLARVSPVERTCIVNLLAVAAALDGTFSQLERRELDEAFGHHTQLYYRRILALRNALIDGHLSLARSLSDLSFSPPAA